MSWPSSESIKYIVTFTQITLFTCIIILEPEGRSPDGSDNFFPQNKPQTEDALHKSVGRFSVQFYILKNTNKCSIIIAPPHKTESSENC